MAAESFHVGKNGPAPCGASVRDCPLGGAHYGTMVEAEKAFAKEQSKASGLFPRFKKPKAPEEPKLYNPHHLELHAKTKKPSARQQKDLSTMEKLAAERPPGFKLGFQLAEVGTALKEGWQKGKEITEMDALARRHAREENTARLRKDYDDAHKAREMAKQKVKANKRAKRASG